jgi:triosephosphate isomerase
MGKWSNDNIPTEYHLTGRLEEIPMGQLQEINKFHVVGWAFVWYFLPLSLILLAETIWLRRKTKRTI